jgi:uncharacterized protein YjbJ (UPF0337 family)
MLLFAYAEWKRGQMNQDQAQGKWDQIKVRAKEAWGVLTDDDFKRAEGSARRTQ